MNLKGLFRFIGLLPMVIILAVSLPFLCVGLYEANKVRDMQANFETAQGTVVGNDYLSSTDAEDNARVTWTYHPVVRFKTTQGREYYFTDGVGTYPAEYEVGEGVAVLYDPADPHDASIKTWTRIWMGPLWITLIGLIPVLAWGIWMVVRTVIGNRAAQAARKAYNRGGW